jgi:hypothetical protein
MRGTDLVMRFPDPGAFRVAGGSRLLASPKYAAADFRCLLDAGKESGSALVAPARNSLRLRFRSLAGTSANFTCMAPKTRFAFVTTHAALARVLRMLFWADSVLQRLPRKTSSPESDDAPVSSAILAVQLDDRSTAGCRRSTKSVASFNRKHGSRGAPDS